MSSTHIFELRSIDAWREREGGWTWNTSYKLEGGICFDTAALKPRIILKKLREWGYLTGHSKGRVRVQDDDSVIEIQDKGTGKPLLALMLTKAINHI